MTNWGPIGQQVYERTYSRRKPDGTQETWPETVDRVVRGNCALVPEEFIRPTEREDLARLIERFDILPAGRHLWVSGVEGRQFLFNCHRAGWTDKLEDHFCFVFDELMKGGGIGSNYSNCYMERGKVSEAIPRRLYVICSPAHPDYAEVDSDVLDSHPLWEPATVTVDDSREGWVEALRALFTSAEDELVVDVSNVRSRGSIIHGFGGTASGPGPLADMLRSAWMVLDKARGRHLTSLEAMDIDHHISRCVIAGNVRRSARMSIKNWADIDIYDFLNCKSDTDSHWSTNISVELDRKYFTEGHRSTHAYFLRTAIAEAALKNGEPGLFNSYLASEGEDGDVRSTNPCGEIALEEWENCNLGHINLGQVTSGKAQRHALELMTRFLIRATFSDIDNPLQREVVDRNRRIGVGIFGFQEWCINNGIKYSEVHKHIDMGHHLRWMQDIVNNEAGQYSNELGIPRPIKTTTVAPTGSIAKLSGATEGIHPVYAKHFIRRVRYDANDPNLASLGATTRIEDDIYSAGTKVAEFVCADQIFQSMPFDRWHLVESVEDISLDDMLAVQAFVQKHWANNAVSFTVNFPDGKYDVVRIRDAMFNNIANLKGTTVMPDGTRPQAPYERISEADYLLTRDTEHFDASFDECAGGACPIK